MRDLKCGIFVSTLFISLNVALGKLYDYRAIQLSVRINSTENEYIVVHKGENGAADEIEFKRDITEDTGLMVRVIFGDEDGPIHPQVADSNEMNICTMLENAMENSTSSQAKYRMAESLNLHGRRCPINAVKGRAQLGEYSFPSEFTTNKDMGCGYVTFLMRVETPGSTWQSYQSLLELFVELDLTKPDGC